MFTKTKETYSFSEGTQEMVVEVDRNNPNPTVIDIRFISSGTRRKISGELLDRDDLDFLVIAKGHLDNLISSL